MPTNHPGFERYSGWLAIPYLAEDGHPVSVRFRRPDWASNDGPKYLGLPHEKGRIYGVQSFLGGAPNIHVAEGEFDSLILRKVFGSAVGYPGANFWEPHHRMLFEGFVNVYIWGDGDAAGRDFSNKLAGKMRNAKPVYVPNGHDVTSLYMEHGGNNGGAAALERMIA